MYIVYAAHNSSDYYNDNICERINTKVQTVQDIVRNILLGQPK